MGDARWFDRSTVRKMLDVPQGTSDPETGLPSVPGEHAIAHHLIKSWVDGFDFSQLAPQVEMEDTHAAKL